MAYLSRNQNRLLHGSVDGLASGCVFKKWYRTCSKVNTCSFSAAELRVAKIIDNHVTNFFAAVL